MWSSALWARGFRPFFLAAGVWGFGLMPIWLAMWTGRVAPPPWLAPPWWHAHEMVFGFVPAAVAGFLLTSVPVWTGTRAVSGGPLGALVALWLLGRIAMALAGQFPAPWVAVADLVFLPALALVLARPLFAARNPRNYGFVAILLLLAAANVAIHLEAIGVAAGIGSGALRVAVYGVSLLVVIVGGRIVPSFTRNALVRTGAPGAVRSRAWLNRLSVPAVLLFALCDVAAPQTLLPGISAALVALILFARMSGWQSQHTLHDPLLWSLHLGYVWLPIGFACTAISDLAGWLPESSGLHALTAGGFGTMILAVMTRVAVGHTGRPLRAPPGIAPAYLLVTAAALLRSFGPALLPARTLETVVASGLLWAAAFAIFVAVYLPILTRPRVDGAPG